MNLDNYLTQKVRLAEIKVKKKKTRIFIIHFNYHIQFYMYIL